MVIDDLYYGVQVEADGYRETCKPLQLFFNDEFYFK